MLVYFLFFMSAPYLLLLTQEAPEVCLQIFYHESNKGFSLDAVLLEAKG